MSRFSNFSDEELDRIGHAVEEKEGPGSVSPLRHKINVIRNQRRSDSELMRIVEEKERVNGKYWAIKARLELRHRGHSDY